jgi:phosphoenolpyruvate carboxylase
VAEYERLAGDGRLAQAADLDSDALSALLGDLRDLEQRVSTKRKAYHDRIDALQAELTRRYQTGEASVDTLLEPT